MIKHLANWLLAAVFQQREESKPQSQAPEHGREELGLPSPPSESDNYDQAHRELEASLATGNVSIRWLKLADDTPILLQLHHAPGSCELHPFHLHRGKASSLGWLVARVRQTDDTSFPTELNSPDHRYLFIKDFILTNRGNGLGSCMLQVLADIGRTLTPVCRIEGAISAEDWEHVERLERFYSRHGYTVELDRPNRSGRIVKWL
jgi:hypothetical protein